MVVDTNVLVHAINEESQFHAACGAWLRRRIRQPETWYTTWSVLYEFLRVTTHARLFPRPLSAKEAWEFVHGLLSSPGLNVLNATARHSDVAAQVISELPHLSGNIFHDAHIAVLMREHGIRTIVTRDTAFYRFPFLEVIDPVASG